MSRITYPLLIILLFVWGKPALAQSSSESNPDPLILTGEQDVYPLGLHLEILEDPSGELTIDDVIAPDFDSRFTASQDEVPNLGFTDSVYWARLPIRNETQLTNQWYLEYAFANMQFLDLYTPLPDGEGFAVRQTGNQKPLSTRDVFSPRFIFNLDISPQTQQTIYLRFQSGASMTLALTLMTQEAFTTKAQLEQAGFGLFFGALLALLIYHIFLVFSLRETSYLLFVFLLASLLVAALSYYGYLEIYLFPSLFSLKLLYFPLSFSLLLGFIVLFSDSFLELRTRLPKHHRVSILLVGGWATIIILTPFISYYINALLMSSWALISLAVTSVTVIASWRKGFRPARFFMVAWLGALVSFFVLIAVRQGSLPSTPLSENAYLVGLIFMAVCWSVALADRINLFKAETENANRELRHSEHKLSQILEGLPVGVVVYGKNLKPIYINERVNEILSNPAQGIQPDLAAGRTLDQAMDYFSLQVSGTHQKYPLGKMPVYRALQGETASADNIEAAFGDLRVPLEIWASPVRNHAGEVESAVVAFQDITLRKQTAAELDRYREHLEQLVHERTAELSVTNERLQNEIFEREILEKLLQQHIDWLKILNQARQIISGEADLSQAYELLSSKILQLLDARVVFLLHWDGQAEKFEAVCQRQHDEALHDLTGVAAIMNRDSALRKEIELGKLIYMSADQAAALPAPIGTCFQENGFQSLILMPLIVRESVSGVCGVALSQSMPEMSPAQAEFVETIANDLADLAEDAYLLDRAQALVAAEERNRLARDLHDSVTQVLFSASLVAEVLPKIWRRDPERALKSLEELRRLTRGALAEMRTMLLELRPASVLKTPLHDLLAQLTEAITGRIELPFQLFVEQIPPLPAEVHTNFYRIAQEALNNVVKYAQASNVAVSLSATPRTSGPTGNTRHEVKLVIADDGVGFSPDKEWQENLGLGIMRERAAGIQATLSIESQPGHGTQVTLIWRG